MYEVIVGNIGTVYSGPNFNAALEYFKDYRGMSVHNIGRAAGEEVTLFHDGEIASSHVASNVNEE